MTERYEWHAAYGMGPCGCPYDADALIDLFTGEVVEWRCGVCGEQRPHFSEVVVDDDLDGGGSPS